MSLYGNRFICTADFKCTDKRYDGTCGSACSCNYAKAKRDLTDDEKRKYNVEDDEK